MTRIRSQSAAGRLAVIAAAIMLFHGAGAAHAATTWLAGDGNWFDSTRWSAGVPDGSTAANFPNAGTAQVTSGTTSSFGVTLSHDGAAIDVSGTGTLGNTGFLDVTRGSLRLGPGGTVNTQTLNVGSLTQPAAFTITGGTYNANMLNVGTLGTFTQSGGAVAGVVLGAGNIGDLTFGGDAIVTGGSINVNDIDLTGQADFVMTGGTLTTNRLDLIGGGEMRLAEGVTASLGDITGGFTHAGATITGRSLMGGKMKFELDGDDLLAPIIISMGASFQFGGTLSVSIVDALDQFDNADVITLLDAGGPIGGPFANVGNGQRLDVNGGSFQVNYGLGSPFGNDKLVLSDFQAVPEPATGMLLGAGAAGASLQRRRRNANRDSANAPTLRAAACARVERARRADVFHLRAAPAGRSAAATAAHSPRPAEPSWSAVGS